MDQGLRCPDSDPEDLAHFFVLIAFDVVEQKRGATRGRKLPDGALELQVACSATSSARECRAQGLRSRLFFGATAPQVVEAAIDAEPVEPSAEGGAAFELVDLVVGLQEDLLQQVLGIGAVLKHSEREAENTRAVTLIERFERVDISGSQSRHEELVFGAPFLGVLLCERGGRCRVAFVEAGHGAQITQLASRLPSHAGPSAMLLIRPIRRVFSGKGLQQITRRERGQQELKDKDLETPLDNATRTSAAKILTLDMAS